MEPNHRNNVAIYVLLKTVEILQNSKINKSENVSTNETKIHATIGNTYDSPSCEYTVV